MSRSVRFAVMAALLLPFAACIKPAPKADVVIWHWMTDRQEAFDKLAKQYEQEKGVKVSFETYAPSEAYRDKVRAAATGKLLPEIYSPLGDKREVASYINAGYIADLTDVMNQGWKDRLFAKPLAQNTFPDKNEWGVKGGIYGVPIDINDVMIYYNKDLFRQAGLDPEKPPKTWDEFIAAGRKLRAAGIQPFASGFGEGWLIGAFAASYEWNLLGKQGVLDTISGKIKYTDPRWVRIFSVFDEMRKSGIFASGAATMVNKDAERVFSTGKAAMALNGSWAVNVYYNMDPKLNFGVMLPPVLAEAKYPMMIFGGEGSSFNVNPNSPNKDKAIAFLQWMTEPKQQAFLAEETRNIPANREAAKDVPPLLKQFADNIDKTFDPLPVAEAWQVVNVLNADLQSIVIGEKTPQTAAQEIQAEKDRQQQKAP